LASHPPRNPGGPSFLFRFPAGGRRIPVGPAGWGWSWRQMGRWLCLFLLLLFIINLSGCWDRKDIEDLAFIQVLCVDWKEEDGSYQITLELPRPQEIRLAAEGGFGQGQTALLVSGTGKSLSEALAAAKAEFPRYLFLGHINALIVGEEVARAGVEPVLDFFSRHPEFRLRTLLLVSRGPARAILATRPGVERNLGAVFDKEFRQRALVSTIPAKMFYEFTEELMEPGVDPHTAGVRPSKETEAGSINLETVALFREDRLVGWLEREEAMAFLWLRGESAVSEVVVRDEASGVKATLEIYNPVRELKVRPGPTGPLVDFKWRAMARLKEMEGAEKFDLALLERLTDLAEETIKSRLDRTFARLQREFHTDSLGLGQELRRSSPRYWQEVAANWSDVYGELQLRSQVKVTLWQAGLSVDPIRAR